MLNSVYDSAYIEVFDPNRQIKFNLCLGISTLPYLRIQFSIQITRLLFLIFHEVKTIWANVIS